MKPYRLTVSIALALLTGAVGIGPAGAAEDEKAVLLTGLSLPAFVKAFNAHAKGDQEPLIEVRECEQRPIPNSKKKTFACITGTNSFLHGALYENGTLQHISIDGKPQSPDAMHRYRRASGYMVRAVKGGSILGVGTVVVSLLSATAKANGKLQEIQQYGLSLSANRDDEFGWSFGAEAAR